MTDVVPQPHPLPHLATPGERLGWIFNDRNLYRRRYLEPPPQPGTVPPDFFARMQREQSQMGRRIMLSLGIGTGLAVLIGCCGGGLASFGDSGDSSTAITVFAVLIFLLGVGGAAF